MGTFLPSSFFLIDSHSVHLLENNVISSYLYIIMFFFSRSRQNKFGGFSWSIKCTEKKARTIFPRFSPFFLRVFQTALKWTRNVHKDVAIFPKKQNSLILSFRTTSAPMTLLVRRHNGAGRRVRGVYLITIPTPRLDRG